ncbi:hypothetical protein [Burkholderia cenocepacia]|uniref:hypothetical protein n=1 Tax=Burkholderia cenocepacia TaxID=95486 RepID=UPI0007614F2F|nr:hypothetical protein [Burkholderia cenocepacia]KWU24736.1 hypothetical protein AS149_31825 [Burkholderia cenocepacia]
MSNSTALNFTPHAIEDLQRRLVGMKKSAQMPRSTRAHEEMLDLLRIAVKFNLPGNGELVALESLDEAFSEFVRLPFEAVALESSISNAMEVYDSDDAFKEAASSKRIAVCWSNSFAARFPTLCPVPADKKGFYVASVYFDDDDKTWILSPLASYIPDCPKISRGADAPTNSANALEHDFLLKNKVIKASNSTYECWTVQLCPEFITLFAMHAGSHDAAMARLSIDIRDETTTALGFCLTINSSNIKRERIAPSEKLNKKRIANGKPPFFESWVLDLDRPGEKGESTREGYTLDGNRLAPRLHLRRGHIRRLSADRITFVRATAVGSLRSGQIEKTYKVGSVK